LTPPASKPDHVLDRGNGVLIGVGRVHAPAEIGAIGQGKKRRFPPPLAPTEGPACAKEVQREPRIDDGSPREPSSQSKPGIPHRCKIIPAAGVYSPPYGRRTGFGAASAAVSGRVPDFPQRDLSQQLLPWPTVASLAAPGQPVSRPMG